METSQFSSLYEMKIFE